MGELALVATATMDAEPFKDMTHPILHAFVKAAADGCLPEEKPDFCALASLNELAALLTWTGSRVSTMERELVD